VYIFYTPYPNLEYPAIGFILRFMTKSRYSPLQDKLQLLLKEIRNNAGLRQVDLAKRLEQPQSFVSKYEMGERLLTFLEVRQICHGLGISMEDFIRKFESMLDETK
jgi:ribosome-binding protein aMBF1 (putative translation factor)